MAIYEYRLQLPDSKDVVLGACNVRFPFDADDYFPAFARKNSLSILRSMGLNNDKILAEEVARLEIVEILAVEEVQLEIVKKIDSGAVLAALCSKNGEAIKLLEADKIVPNKYNGRRFTYQYLFKDGWGSYDGNMLTRLKYKVIDFFKSGFIRFL